MPSKTIFLIGFMGSGKTTIGRKLATRLGLEFVDLDAAIERVEGMYVRDIISVKGEPYFREAESHILMQLDLPGKVVATGGGTPYYFDNLNWMKANGKVVYIELDEAALYSRLKTTNLEHRPLLRGLDDEGLKKFINTKLAERKPFYTQAHISYNPIREELDVLVRALD